MRHDFIDRYSRIESKIHKQPPALKVFVAVGIILAALIVPIYFAVFFISLVVLLSVTVALSKIPMRFIFRRMLLLEPIIVSAALLSIFQTNGFVLFLKIIIKSTICLFTMLMLSNTTPFDDILLLLKKIKTPVLFVTILALMYRYIFLLIDEQERIQRARISRTFIDNKSEIWKMRAMMISQLFIRSTERAERIYSSMRARGWR